MIPRAKLLQQHSRIAAARLLSTKLAHRSAAGTWTRGLPGAQQQQQQQQQANQIRKRFINVQLLSEEPTSAGTIIQRPNAESQLHDLAADMVAALETTQSAALSRWANRIRTLSTGHGSGGKVGVIHSGPHSNAVVAAKGTNIDYISFMDASASSTSNDVFVDWLYSCDRVVVVAERAKLVQTLASSAMIYAALRLHPGVVLIVEGLEVSCDAVDAFSGLLRESLQMLGVVSPTTDNGVFSVAPAEDVRSVLERLHKEGAHSGLLASAIGAAISSAETGYVSAPFLFGSPTVASNGHIPSPVFSSRIMQFLSAHSQQDAESMHMTATSKTIQRDFECGDLTTVDSSAGAIKYRTQQWFASGKVWQALFMRVYEVADNLIDNAILDRSFEAADLGMIHAAGRLNESIPRVAAEMANELEMLSRNPAAIESIDSSALESAIRALRAMACQTDCVDQFVLAQHVWAARKGLVDSDALESIPRHMHWSLSQFWAIHASAFASATTASVYFEVPLQYAATGGLGLSLLAFVWLGRRWNQLERIVYGQLDVQTSSLRKELIDAHRQVLETKLDKPIIASLQGIADSQQIISNSLSPKHDDISVTCDDIPLSEWKSQLESATFKSS
ncbi:hypothetical protein LPJ66_006582 [Kickxella alabastrina]|uniref:Uncharacterized protein n=1 Tax=Kickxella alabastrina TaxID=61397 RepID=A0ACC1ICQ3_9FUNG|nr:hypothetical protein LPJ66_006582 [Kickxella alabastrina]